MSSTLSSYRDFVTQAETIAPFTPAFNALVHDIFNGRSIPENEALLMSLEHGYDNTVRLLKDARTELENSLSPDVIIEELEDHGADVILTIAYLAKATRILHDRTAQTEKELLIP
jgi:hypothetical protein